MPYIALALFASLLALLYLMSHVARSLRAERQINALGGHAPQVQTRLPFGSTFLSLRTKLSCSYRRKRKTKHRRPLQELMAFSVLSKLRPKAVSTNTGATYFGAMTRLERIQ